MAAIALFSRILTHPGRRDELVALIDEVLEEVSQQPGTLAFSVHAEGDDVLWVYELYADQEAYDAHRAGEVFRAVQPKIAPLLDGRPDNHVLPAIREPHLRA